MKVFVLIKDSYDFQCVVGVYANQATAQAEADRLNEQETNNIISRGGNPDYGDDWSVEEYEVK